MTNHNRCGLKTGYIEDDGGRKAAGRKSSAQDCIVRAVAVLEQCSYLDALKACQAAGWRLTGEYVNPKTGKRYTKFNRKQARNMFAAMGYAWAPWNQKERGRWGTADDAPDGVMLKMRKHVVAKVGGCLHDSWDSRTSTFEDPELGFEVTSPRAVYGWYVKGGAEARKKPSAKAQQPVPNGMTPELVAVYAGLESDQ